MTRLQRALYIVIGVGVIGGLIALVVLPDAATAPFGKSVRFVKNTGISIVTISEAFIRDETIELDQPFTLLILGQPGEPHAAPNLTDTIVIAHLEPSDPLKPLLISLPRDLLVPTNGENATKINAIYQQNGTGSRGRAAIREIVEDITGLRIDAVVLLDLAAVSSTINAVGGINIYVREKLIDTQFPTPNRGTTTITFERGWRWMDGETATAYVRTRATPRGDFDRIARQQDVLRTIHQKVIGLHPLWDLPTLLSIWRTLGTHMESDLSVADIKTLVDVVRSVSIDNVQHLFIDPSRTDLVAVNLILLGGIPTYAIAPREGVGNYDAIQDYIASFMR